ncbi:hypothetical protein C8K15_101139 [Paenisporosarcina sp. OV554]|nr:hypothetical protein C8K15_101139 [Paenisporosarcina sp. OV554]
MQSNCLTAEGYGSSCSRILFVTNDARAGDAGLRGTNGVRAEIVALRGTNVAQAEICSLRVTDDVRAEICSLRVTDAARAEIAALHGTEIAALRVTDDALERTFGMTCYFKKLRGDFSLSEDYLTLCSLKNYGVFQNYKVN